MLEDVAEGLEDEVVVISVVADEIELLVDDGSMEDVVEDVVEGVVDEDEDVVDDVVEDVVELGGLVVEDMVNETDEADELVDVDVAEIENEVDVGVSVEIDGEEVKEIERDAEDIAIVVDVELEADEDESVKELAKGVEDAALEIEDILDDELDASLLYMFNFNDPPQYSWVLPLQSIVHPVAPGPVVPAARVFPQ